MAEQVVDSLRVVRDLLIANGGGYLRNVQWGSPLVCPLCAGVPNEGYRSCYNCGGWIGRDDLADRIAFVSYAINRSQSGTVMYGYKDPQPSMANRRVVTLMHHYVLIRHWHCLQASSLGPVTHWTTVPSSSGRAGVHPLTEIASSLLDQRLTRVELAAAPTARKSRDLRPSNFAAQAEVVRDRHVLLVEDTWVGGANVQSAAAALKSVGGAASVTAFVLARWLEPSRGATRELISSLPPDFDPDICPFTGAACP